MTDQQLLSNLFYAICCFILVLPNCGDPGKPKNAVMSRNHWAGEFVRYLCNPGFTMFGPAVRKCLPGGQWSGNMPNCKTTSYSIQLLNSATNMTR